MASTPVSERQSIRFGEDYELDLRPRRLRRGSHVLKLERIPLEILVLLVEHKGEIVTRDEIVTRVWGKGVFLDTDNSIRGAIRKLRQALKDDAESPRFIQTVTGQGYRFIAPVTAPEEENRTDTPNPEALTVPRNGQNFASEPDWLVAEPADYVWWRKSTIERRGKCLLPKSVPKSVTDGGIGMPASGFLLEQCHCSYWSLSQRTSSPGAARLMRKLPKSLRSPYCL